MRKMPVYDYGYVSSGVLLYTSTSAYIIKHVHKSMLCPRLHAAKYNIVYYL